MSVDVLNVEISHLLYIDVANGEEVLRDPLMVHQASADSVDCLGEEESKLVQVSDAQVYVQLPQVGQALFPVSQVPEVPKYICSINIECHRFSTNNYWDRSS